MTPSLALLSLVLAAAAPAAAMRLRPASPPHAASCVSVCSLLHGPQDRGWCRTIASSAAAAAPFTPPRIRQLACCADPDSVSYRQGSTADLPLFFATMLKEKMNPFGLKHERFVVATDGNGPEEVIGFGQIRKLGDEGKLWELASLWVREDQRGRGVGSELVRRLLRAHEEQGRSLVALSLLTLEPTIAFYEPLGFRPATSDEVPKEMALEVAAGTALSAVLGNKLVCMRWRDA